MEIGTAEVKSLNFEKWVKLGLLGVCELILFSRML